MDNKKWTDSDLKTAFEDGCKFVDFADLQDFLLKRRQLAASIESNCIKPDVSSSVCTCGHYGIERVKYCSKCGKEVDLNAN